MSIYESAMYQVYRQHDLLSRFGILFDTFLLAPDEILEAVAELPDREPLLPAQQAVMHRALLSESLARVRSGMATTEDADIIEEALSGCCQWRGHAYMEPMRHHSVKVSRSAMYRRRLA